jgi:hypothetical protein
VWALGEGRRALGGFGERDDVQALNIGVCVCVETWGLAVVGRVFCEHACAEKRWARVRGASWATPVA